MIEDGKVIGAQHETNTLLPLFTHQYSVVASATRAQYAEDMDRSDHIDGESGDELRPMTGPPRKRRMSIMGTFG